MDAWEADLGDVSAFLSDLSTGVFSEDGVSAFDASVLGASVLEASVLGASALGLSAFFELVSAFLGTFASLIF
jgi:hypothetical protein